MLEKREQKTLEEFKHVNELKCIKIATPASAILFETTREMSLALQQQMIHFVQKD